MKQIKTKPEKEQGDIQKLRDEYLNAIIKADVLILKATGKKKQNKP